MVLNRQPSQVRLFRFSVVLARSLRAAGRAAARRIEVRVVHYPQVMVFTQFTDTMDIARSGRGFWLFGDVLLWTGWRGA
jgi:hypothetical protein